MDNIEAGCNYTYRHGIVFVSSVDTSNKTAKVQCVQTGVFYGVGFGELDPVSLTSGVLKSLGAVYVPELYAWQINEGDLLKETKFNNEFRYDNGLFCIQVTHLHTLQTYWSARGAHKLAFRFGIKI